MDIRVLGSLQVLSDGAPVEIRGAKRRELLSLLVMYVNRTVSTATLVDALWEGTPPPTAAAALRVHVQHLRAALEPQRDASAPVVLTAAATQGYRLQLEPEAIDAYRFEQLVVRGREANLQGDPHAAIALLSGALEEWRGAPYPDTGGLSAMRGEVARLEALRATALEELAESRLAVGDDKLAVELLVSAVDEFPLRERLTGQLMRALYRCGRQADALRAYALLEQRLDEELAVTPSPELRDLERDVLLQSTTLDWLAPRPSYDMAAGARPPTVRFVSRQQELRVLQSAFRRVESGDRRAVVVSGAGGIGKTTLVMEACTRAQRQDVTVFVGHCDEDRIVDALPIIDIVRQLDERFDDASRDACADDVTRLLPERVEPLVSADMADVAEADGDTDLSVRLFDAFAHVVATFAPRPLVLVVEDAQWADRSSLLALRHLLSHPDVNGVLVLVTYRDDEIALARSDLLTNLTSSRRLDTIHLRGFGDNEVGALVKSIAPPEASSVLVALASVVHDMTDGNPLFIRELLRELDEQPIAFDDPAAVRRTLTELAPKNVVSLIERRTTRLTGDAITVLRAAAVLGRDITADTLARVTDLSHEATLDALDELRAAGLVAAERGAGDRYTFSHDLVRTATYAGVVPDVRRLLHRRIGELLAAERPLRLVKSAELAHHFFEARPMVSAGTAAQYARIAADDALQRFAFSEAARWYARAIELETEAGASTAVLGELHFALGRAYDAAADIVPARTAYLAAATCARATGDARLLADVAVAFTGPWSSAFDLERQNQTLALLDEALRVVDVEDSRRRVQVLNAIATACYYVDPEREGRAAREAVELAQTLDDVSIASARLALHRSYTHRPEAVRERLGLAKTACDMTRGTAHAYLHLRMQREFITDLLESGLIAEFDRELDSYQQLAAKVESARHQYWALALRATQATLRGDLRAAEQFARGAALRGRVLPQSSAGAHVLQQFLVRYMQGRLGELVSGLRQVPDVQPGYRAGYALAAVACAETGRPDEGARIVRRALGPNGSLLARDVFWLAGVALFGGVAAAARDHDLVHVLGELLEPHADQVVVFGSGGAMVGCGHHWLGELAAAEGDLDGALEHFERARCRSEFLGAPYWRAHAQVDAAAALARRGAPGDAAERAALLKAAGDTAERCGFGRISAAVANS